MKIDIMTLFPELCDYVSSSSIIGRAQKKGIIEIKSTYIRDFTYDRHHKTDDYPYGGGKGLLLMAEPLFLCHQHLSQGKKVHTVLMSPQGKTFNQEKARNLLEYGHIILVCGHYEGIDERFIEECVDEEISIGDFVLTGGELPALIVADAICRMVPGVLKEDVCFTEESHYSHLLEYPQYTRPEEWRGHNVPEVLLSGHQENIRKWQRKMSLKKTLQVRPDLLEKAPLSAEDLKMLIEINEELHQPD